MKRDVAQRIFDPAAECLDPSARRALQSGRLRATLAGVREASTFYRDTLRHARLDDLTPERLAELPLTTRAELVADQRRAPPFGSVQGARRDMATIAGRSGVGFSVTGCRLNVLATAADVRRQGALFVRPLWEAGVRPGDRVYVADDPRYNLVAMSVMRALCTLGALDVYVGAERSARTARYVMPALPPAHLFLSPTYAGYLPAVLASRPDARWPIRSVSGWGEPGYSVPETRARLATLWNDVSLAPPVAFVDVYAMSETGLVAFGCREGGGLHVVEDAVIVETVDPDADRAAAPGVRGEIVVTLLGAEALPLVRYRTGDTAVLDDGPCPCGRTGRRLVGIERLAERVRVRGRWLSALDVERVLASAGAAAGTILLRSTGDEDALRVLVASAAGPLAVAPDPGPALHRAFGVPVAVERVAADAWPPFLHKTLRVVDHGREAELREELQAQHELERV